MSTGFKNNNPGNINFAKGYNPPGWTGKWTITNDKQKNLIFSSMPYGIAAMMNIIHNDINKRGLKNIYDLDENYVGHSPEIVTQNATHIAKLFSGKTIKQNFLTGSPEEVLLLAKGISSTEIPETISETDWNNGLQLYLSQNNIKPTQLQSSQSLVPYFLLFTVAAVVYFSAR